MRTAGIIVAAIVCLFLVARWLTRRWTEGDRLDMFEQVANLFRFLESEHGMQCVSRTYDAQAFGNVIVRYERQGLSFQLVRDRSQWFFAMGTPDVGSFCENDLLLRCGAADDLNAMITSDWRSLELVSDIVRRRFTALVAELGSDEIKCQAAERQRLQDESLRNLLKGS